MGLNIKNKEVERLARELADRTGESKTAAILGALRDKLAQLHKEDDKDAIVERVMKIARESGPPGPDETSDHSDLYDDRGLPA
jgi:antitoxin VapB